MRGKFTIYNLRFTIIFLFSLFLFLYPIPYTLYPIMAHSEIYTVVMVEDGFEPPEITVDENSTVLFINKDKVDRWPASNIHPTHDIYPEFDPKKPIEPGGSWPFKPKKAGVWKYHDHLFPHVRGSVIVTKDATSSSTESVSVDSGENIFSKIKNYITNFFEKFMATFRKLNVNSKISSEEFKNLKAEQQTNSLKKIFESRGPEVTWSFFKETYKGEAGSSGNIHDLAHLLGSLMYEKGGFETIKICSADYAFGCYHGFLDKAFEKNLDNLSQAEVACSMLGPQNSGPVASCVHGIGHGVASFYNTNDIRSSLLSCNNLKSGSNYCHDGVFMEFERSAPVAFYSKERLYQPCDELGEEFAFACGRNQPTVWIDRFKYGFDEIIQACLGSPSEQFKLACFDALGFNISKGTSDPGQILAFCRKIGVDEFILRCAKAASGELIFQEVPGWQQSSPAVCEMLPANFGADCHNYIQRLRRDYAK